MSPTSNNNFDDEIVLYNHNLSSYAQKIRIALREKRIPFSSILPPDLGTGRTDADAQLYASNPIAEVPVLLHAGNAIFDSTIILEYIDEVWPSPRLMPIAPAEKARARMIEDVCDTRYEAINWGLGELTWMKRANDLDASGELEAAMRARAAEQTRTVQAWLEKQLEASSSLGPYFNEAEFGWADVCAAPIVNRSKYYGNAPAEGSLLAKWLELIKERPSVKETFAEFEEAASKMAGPGVRDLYLKGPLKREYRAARLEWMMKSGGGEIVMKGISDGNIRFSWP